MRTDMHDDPDSLSRAADQPLDGRGATAAERTDQTTATLPHGYPTAGTHLPSHARLWIVAGLGLAADLWTKNWAVTHLEMRSPRVLIENVLNLQLSLNPGALFGLGAGFAPVFIGASMLALVFVVYLFWQSTPRQFATHLALGCVLAGALGNLYDRAFENAYVVHLTDGRRDVGELVSEDHRTGEVTVADFQTRLNERPYQAHQIASAARQPVVRDFISFEVRIGEHTRLWPWIFNIADALLVVGVVVLLIGFWRHPHAGAAYADAAHAT